MNRLRHIHQLAIERPGPATLALGAAAVLCLMLGLLLPSEKVATALAGEAVPHYRDVVTGTWLFRLGLGCLGLIIPALWALARFSTPAGAANSLSSLDSREDDDNSAWFHPWGSLALILIVAMLLRLPGLNSGLWFDEIMTLTDFVSLPLGQLLTSYGDQNNHPLYSLSAGISIQLFGDSIWALRLPAMLFGLASLWALFLLVRHVTDEREAFLATILMAVSYHHVWFSQNARGYTGMLFWVLLGTYFFLRACENGRPALWIAYAVSMALGMYTHLTTLFTLMCHAIIFICLQVRERAGCRPPAPVMWPILAFALVGFLTFQLYALILPQVIASFQVQVGSGRVENWTNPIWAVIELVRGLQIGLGTLLAASIGLFVFLCGVFDFVRRERVVVALFFIPIVLASTVLVALNRHFYPRFFFFTIGIASLLFVRGCTCIGEMLMVLTPHDRTRSRRKHLVGTSLVCLAILVSLLSLPRNYLCPKQDYVGAMAYVEERRREGDCIVAVGLARDPFEFHRVPDWQFIETAEELEEIRENSERTWLLYTFQDHMKYFYPEILSSIERDFSLDKTFSGTVGGGAVYVCTAERPDRSVTSY